MLISFLGHTVKFIFEQKLWVLSQESNNAIFMCSRGLAKGGEWEWRMGNGNIPIQVGFFCEDIFTLLDLAFFENLWVESSEFFDSVGVTLGPWKLGTLKVRFLKHFYFVELDHFRKKVQVRWLFRFWRGWPESPESLAFLTEILVTHCVCEVHKCPNWLKYEMLSGHGFLLTFKKKHGDNYLSVWNLWRIRCKCQQRHRHGFSRGGGEHDLKNYLSQKFCFSSVFGHFIL